MAPERIAFPYPRRGARPCPRCARLYLVYRTRVRRWLQDLVHERGNIGGEWQWIEAPRHRAWRRYGFNMGLAISARGPDVSRLWGITCLLPLRGPW